MSVQFFWDRLTQADTDAVVDDINRTLAAAQRPAFINFLRVAALHFGTIPPEVDVVDITCGPADEADEGVSEGGVQAGLLHDSIAGRLDDVCHTMGDDASHVARVEEDVLAAVVGMTAKELVLEADAMRRQRLRKRPRRKFSALAGLPPIGLVLSLRYRGDFRLSLEMEVSVDVPVPKFVVLPLAVTIANVQLSALVHVQMDAGKARVSLTPVEGQEEVITLADIAVDIGDRLQGVYHDASAVRDFAMRELRRYLALRLVHPNCMEISM